MSFASAGMCAQFFASAHLLQGMEAQVAEVQRSHDKVRLEVEARRQREAAVQREVVLQRAAAAEAGARIR